ncbi:MAG TPA: sterol desaturase family protein, partial [Xanthomonadales bacterium]|nr:sterol desaturase family protein [Xanthomonadales bacterium]
TNLALVVVDTLVLRLAFPVLAVGAAYAMQQRGLGLFNAWDGPYVIELVLAVLALDAAIYFQHRIFHAVPWLWRLHRVHHSDVRFDVTTGVRFHPFEIALSMAIKLALIALLGASPGAVMLFEVLLSCGSLFTHADVALPPRIERVVRALVVTPTMHRVHHSIERDETDSNFSFNLSVWDRLFGSYRAAPRADPASMPIGIHSFREPADQGLLALLVQPFRTDSNRAAAARPGEKGDA